MTVLIRTAFNPPTSYARVRMSERAPLRVGAVQHRWHPDHEEHAAALRDGVGLAADAGARIVCLQELTMSAYFASDPRGARAVAEAVGAAPESLETGPTLALTRSLAVEHGVTVQASLWEADAAVAPRGWNTSICVGPTGELLARTRKVHIPVTEGYREDRYFPPSDGGYPVVEAEGAAFGFPTCWDQWFPELARIYSLSGAEVLVYPTAIGSEPDHPEFDTMPLWRHVIVGNGITSGTFMIAVNRIGRERATPSAPEITFYGSSFISDPYGRVLVDAPRDEPCVLVADLDLDQRRDWLELFPFNTTRRPDTYQRLVR